MATPAANRPSFGSVAFRLMLAVSVTVDPQLIRAQSTALVSINLPPLASPGTGQPSVTPFTVVGSNFPAGTIAPASVKLALEPVVVGTGPRLDLTPSAVTAVLTNTRRVSFQVPGSAGVRPNVGKPSESLMVRLYQAGGGFEAGTSTASFGVGIAVGGAASGGFGSINVLDAEHATAQVVVDASAPVGERVVSVKTGQTTAQLNGGFNVVSAAGSPQVGRSVSFKSPTAYFLTLSGQTSAGTYFVSSNRTTLTLNPDAELISATPATVNPGQNVSVKVSGLYTNFFQGATQASFGPGISVGGATAGSAGPVTVVDDKSITAQIAIQPGAATGLRTIVVNTGVQRAELVNGFSINGGTPTPSITLSPSSGTRGQTLAVAITGLNTHFVQGTTSATFGPGVTVTAFTVSNPTTALTNVTISATSTLGPRSITLTTGSEEASCQDCFVIQAVLNQPPSVSATAGCSSAVSILPNQSQISEYSIPTVPGGPSGIAFGPDCNIWVADYFGSQIWRITSSGTKTSFTPPTAGSRPSGIIAAPDGNLWFTEFAKNNIGRITPSGQITEFSIPTSGEAFRYKSTEPYLMTNGPDGNIWFIEHAANQIAKITPTGVITEYKIPTGGVGANGLTGSEPHGITAGPDGNIWFVEAIGNKIGKISTTGQITEYPIPTASSVPSGIVAGPDGNLWFTEAGTNKIGRITTGGVFLPDYSIPTPNSGPQTIVLGPDGNLWFTQIGVSKIARITPAGVVTEFSAAPNSIPVAFTAGPDGYLWFTELQAPGYGKINVFNGVAHSSLSGQTSDDGLPANSQLSTSWTVVSGPGPVSFSAPSASFDNTAGINRPVSTTAQFSAPGSYVLALSASDSQLSRSANVTVTVGESASSPTITSVSPSSGTQGQSNLALAITGLNTHFVQGTTQVTLGAGVTVNGLTVTGPSQLTAVITIAANAAIGPRSVSVTTGTEIVTLANGFQISVSSPIISSISPNSGAQAESGPVAITGQNTHFVQGITQLDLGAGVSVSNVAVSCATCLSAQAAIAEMAALGPRTVTVTTGSEVVTLANGFTVTAGTPRIISFNPTGGRQGQTFTLTVVGRFTHFAQGTTSVALGAGVSIGSISVTSPTSITAAVTIAADATLGTRLLTVTTGAEVVSVPDVFNVQAGIPVLLSSTPAAIQQAQSLSIAVTGQFTNFTQGSTVVSFGAGITVNSVSVVSKTSLTANVTAATSAAIGARNLSVTTGAESVSLANALTVSAAPVIILTSVVPNTGNTGQTISVAINGQGTSFAAGNTTASFGPGISVGGAAAGALGPVTVVNATQATAQLTIAPTAALGLRTITVQTGSQQLTLSSGFAVNQGGSTNQPPTVSAGSNQTIALPASAILAGTVTDDGLPVGATLTSTWSKTSGPGIVTFANPNSPATTATFSLSGTYILRLTASDTEFTVFSEVAVIVQAANQPPTITINPTWSVVLPSRLTVTYTVSDDRLPSNGVLTVSWDTVGGPGDVGYRDQTPSLNNVGSVSVGFSQAGTYVLRITATDTQYTVSQQITVTVTGTPNPAPTVTLTSPTEGQEVTTQVAVTGSVSATSLEFWRVEIRAADETEYRTIGTGTSGVQNGQLATFDPTVLLNGIYYIRLRANDISGSFAVTQPVAVVLTKNQKIGNFTVSFNDLTVPLPGVPIQIVRTYDSRMKSPGDFSYGWTLDLRSVRASANIIQGTQWSGTITGTLLPNYCIQATKAHVVSVVLPDGTTHRFQPTLTPTCQQGSPIIQTTMGFSPLPGTVASLAVVGNNLVQVSGGFPGNFELYDTDTVQPIDPTQYRLTLPDGRSMVISVTSGLQNMADLNGNRITVTPAGIQHSNGTNVTFTRDLAQRITRITDPAGSFIDYTYNLTTGDLQTVKDQEGNLTTFLYAGTSHYLSDIQDPRGIKPIRNEYDASGRLTKHIDAFGKEIVYTHNIGTRQEVVTDRLNNVTVNEYDADGNVTRVVDPEGGITSRTYDSRGNTLSETNPLGKKRDYVYDAQDNRIQEKDPLGFVTNYEYNARKQVTKITDAENRVTENTYDAANGNLTQTKDPLGGITTYLYNAAGQQTQVTDPTGAITRYRYDNAGNLIEMTDAENAVTTYTYDANRNKKSETRSRTTPTGVETVTTLFDYDKLNRVIKTTYADSSTTQTTYNSIGKQATTVDQLGRTTRYEYDELGRLAKTTFPDGTTETSSFDAEGRRVRSTDRENRATTYQYDKLGRLRVTTFADNATSETVYDLAGQVTRSFDARRTATDFAYDDSGRRTRVTNALGQVTQFGYDKVGNQTSITDASNVVTQFQYDANNRRTITRYADLTTDQVGYDAAGRSSSKTDQAGRVTQYRYDKLGRLTQVIDALNQSTFYTYDEAGNRTSQRDARTNTTRFEYDKMGRRTKRTLPLGQSETFQYDAAGNMRSKTDFNGRTTTYQYDPNNNWLTRKTPDAAFNAQPITFAYWQGGQRRTMTDPSGTTNYTYDLRDRLLQKQTPQGTLSYTYDVQGNLGSIRSSNTGGTSVNYAYDSLNRLWTVTDNRMAAPNQTAYTYDSVGNLKSYTYPNGVRHEYTYSSLNRLRDLAVTRGATTLASYAYTLGPTGNRQRVAEFGGRTVDYTYDELYRLKSETIAGGTVNGVIGYVYDPVGNRLSRTSTVAPVPAQTFAYDANDRLDTDTYDNAGNTTGSGGDTLAYDFENHLISKNSGQVTIVYDGDGNRVAKTVGGVTTRYGVDERNLTGYAQVLEELSGATVQRVYTYGLNRINQSQASGTSFYGYDGHGSVRLLTDASGAVADRYEYETFGTIINQVGFTPNVYLYSGEQNDPNLGLLYLRARYMNSTSGRFLTLDPIDGSTVDPPSLHKYQYASANPVNLHDPSGLITIQETSVTVAIVGILAHYTAATVIANKTFDYLPANPFSGPPDAALFGFQAGVAPTAKLAKTGNLIAAGIAAGLSLGSFVGGVDVLIPLSSPSTAWVYAYGGYSIGLVPNYYQDVGGGSIGGYVGFVWNAKSPSSYLGPFFALSGSFVPAYLRSFAGAGVTIFSSKGGTYGYSIGISTGTRGPSSGLSVSVATAPAWGFHEESLSGLPAILLPAITRTVSPLNEHVWQYLLGY